MDGMTFCKVLVEPILTLFPGLQATPQKNIGH